MFGNFKPKGSLIYFVESCGLDCTVLITRDYNWFIDQDGAEPLDTSTFPILTFFPEVMRSTTPKEFSTDKHIDPFPSSFPTLSEPELIIGTETIPPLLERTSTEFSTNKHIDPFPNPFPTLSEPELIIGTETIPPILERTSTEFSTDKHIELLSILGIPGYSTETLLVKTDEFPALFNERLDIDVSETRQCLQVGKFRGVSKVDF